MHRSKDRILTTHPGRLPNPANQQAVIAAKNSGDAATFKREAQSGMVSMIERQKQIGIDILSDGEFWKGRDQKYYDSRVSGIKSMPLQPGQSPSLTHDLRERTSDEFKAFYDAFDKVGNAPMPGVVNPPPSVRWAIVDEVKAVGDAAIKSEIELVKGAIEAAGEKVENFFFPVLGPGWLDHFVMNDYYKTEEEYVYAMALVAKADFKAVADAGFVLQIDDPGLVDTWAMLSPAPSIEDYRKRIQLRVEATNWALEGVDEEMIRFHTCWGSWHTPHVTDLHLKHTVDIMLNVKASAYSIEAADVQHVLDYEVWENTKFPDGKVFIPGVIAHKTSTVEPPELVAHRIVQYANIMGRENVVAGVDCGVGGRCYPDIGWAKLKALADGAAMASKQLWK